MIQPSVLPLFRRCRGESLVLSTHKSQGATSVGPPDLIEKLISLTRSDMRESVACVLHTHKRKRTMAVDSPDSMKDLIHMQDRTGRGQRLVLSTHTHG